MTTTIREMRLDDIEPAINFAQQHGSSLTADDITSSMSLIALDTNTETDTPTILGLILTKIDAQQGDDFTLQITLADTADPALAQTLLDTALFKLQSQRLGHTHITFADGSTPDNLWSATKWTPQTFDSPLHSTPPTTPTPPHSEAA